jgi:hypothetical protein
MSAAMPRNANLRHRSNRAQLFAGVAPTSVENGPRSLQAKKSSNGRTPISNKNKNGAAVEEAKAVTSSLLRTKNMIRQELNRVYDVTNVIEKDGEILKDTTLAHQGLNSIVKSARHTLQLLKRQDIQDVVILWSAVVFFYCCALYVAWTRMRIPFLLW